MAIVAILDSLNRFLGVEDVPEGETADRIVVPADIDLPDDGTYRWDKSQQAFVPRDQAAASMAQVPPIPESHAVFLALRALVRGEPVPDDVRDYVDWYDRHLRARAEVRARPTKRLLRGGP